MATIFGKWNICWNLERLVFPVGQKFCWNPTSKFLFYEENGFKKYLYIT